MFPFVDLNELKLVKLLCKKKKLTTKPTQSQQTDANVTIRSKTCSVYMKTNSKIDKSVKPVKPVKQPMYIKNV